MEYFKAGSYILFLLYWYKSTLFGWLYFSTWLILALLDEKQFTADQHHRGHPLYQKLYKMKILSLLGKCRLVSRRFHCRAYRCKKLIPLGGLVYFSLHRNKYFNIHLIFFPNATLWIEGELGTWILSTLIGRMGTSHHNNRVLYPRSLHFMLL